ncbi:MAG: MBL fold metallo-hydrolase [Anaerolineae bacterium]
MKTGLALVHEIDHTELDAGTLAFWWLGQLGYVLKIAGKVLYLDPFLRPHAARTVPPLLRPEEVTHADWVLGSHAHDDHLDPWALPRLMEASPQARVVCSRVAQGYVVGCGVPSERTVALDAGMSLEEDGLRITAIAAKHEFFDRDETLGYPYLGYIVEGDGLAVYHAGDTLWYEGLVDSLSPWRLDLAFLPINGRDATRLARGCIGNMTYQEAVDLAGALEPRLTVPGHYEMFRDNSADPHAFAAYMDVKYPHLRHWEGGHGERVLLSPNSANTK